MWWMWVGGGGLAIDACGCCCCLAFRFLWYGFTSFDVLFVVSGDGMYSQKVALACVGGVFCFSDVLIFF